jgi:leader peptidase (prepilin peptidase)/N-methyltransferase
VVFVIDLEKGLILNKMVYPFALVALGVSLIPLESEFIPEFISSLGGGALGFILFLLIVIITGGGMGMGDVKLAAFIGLALGFPKIIVALFLSILLGGIVAILLLISGKKGRKQAVPFGPFMSIGALSAIVFGQNILDWYVGLF